jgi:hypothetical protein
MEPSGQACHLQGQSGVRSAECFPLLVHSPRRPKHTWKKNIMYSVLIEHPEEGLILYEVGSGKGDGSDEDYTERSLPLHATMSDAHYRSFGAPRRTSSAASTPIQLKSCPKPSLRRVTISPTSITS